MELWRGGVLISSKFNSLYKRRIDSAYIKSREKKSKGLRELRSGLGDPLAPLMMVAPKNHRSRKVPCFLWGSGLKNASLEREAKLGKGLVRVETVWGSTQSIQDRDSCSCSRHGTVTLQARTETCSESTEQLQRRFYW